MMIVYGMIEFFIEVIKRGVYYYIMKFLDIEEFYILIEKMFEY